MGVNGKILTAAILASGNGSNAENILQYAAQFPKKIKIPLVITDNKNAGVIMRARALGVPCAVVEREGNRAAQEEKIIALLKSHSVDWIFLAGYMAILSPVFVDQWRGRIVNIHPSLLPQFPGRDGYGDAFRANVATSGVTLHFVDEGIDTGPVILQKEFSRSPEDTLESFRARGMALEYQLYREFINNLIKEAAA